MGTASFGIPSLKKLLDKGYPVIGIVTVPDKPAGRGQHLSMSPVKLFSLEHQLPVLQPESLRDEAFIAQVKALAPDLMIVVAFRILPPEVYTLPRCGTFNLHASLLPKYRGAAPIQWAVINGERETGVTTFFLEQKVDTGNILLQARLPIGPDETSGDLYEKLADVGAEIVLHTTRLIEQGRAVPRPQDPAQATPAPKIFRDDCRIDWHKSAGDVHNFIRGLSPRPCAFTYHRGIKLKIYRSQMMASDHTSPPGTVLAAGKIFTVAAAQGIVSLLHIQQEGRKALPAGEFLRGYTVTPGDLLQ